jgi:hypothetical protein
MQKIPKECTNVERKLESTCSTEEKTYTVLLQERGDKKAKLRGKMLTLGL